MTITRHLANKRNWNLWSLLFDVDDKCNCLLQNLPKIPSKTVPQHPLVSAQSASCNHFSVIYLTRNYLGTISDVYWIHVYLILILFPPRVLLDILTSLLASYLTPIFVRKSASLITVKHKGPFSELYKYLVVQIILGWCKLYVNHRHFLWLFWIICTFVSAFLYYWYKNPFFLIFQKNLPINVYIYLPVIFHIKCGLLML